MRRLAIPVLIAVALLSIPVSVRGCTCEIFGDGTERGMLHYSKAVFVGEVLEVRQATKEEREDGSDLYFVRLRVERYWKGIKTSEIWVGADMYGCGPNFEVGQKYLVNARGKKRLSTSICMRTRKLEYAADDLKALGPGKQLKAKS